MSKRASALGAIFLIASTALLAQTPGKALGQGVPVKAPAFEDYKVDSVYRGRPAPVDFAPTPGWRSFRTVLREGARFGPDFAGHMTLVTWGCGSDCVQFAVVDARTGRIYDSPVQTSADVDGRLDSRLLVIGRVDCPDTVDAAAPPYAVFLEWTGTALSLIDSLPNSRICTPPPAALGPNDLRVGRVGVDDDSAMMLRVLGKPLGMDSGWFLYKDLRVLLKSGKVAILSIRGRSRATARGLAVGDRLERIVHLYQECLGGDATYGLAQVCYNIVGFDERAIVVNWIPPGRISRIDVGRILKP